MTNTKIRLITFFAATDAKDIQSQKKKKKRSGADYRSNHELLIVKFRLKLEKK